MKLPNPFAGLPVSRLMAPLRIFVNPRDLATHARAVMREHRIKVLPVVEGGRLEGIVTQRGILRVTSTRSNIPVAGVMEPVKSLITPSTELTKAALFMVNEGLDEIPIVQSPTDRTAVGVLRMDDLLRHAWDSIPNTVKVRDVMVSDVVFCNPNDELTHVWDLMEREKLSGLPVVEESKGKLSVVGVITRTDIIRYGGVRTAEESKKGRAPAKVKSIMRTPVITIQPQALLSRAIELVLTKKVKRLPVVDSGALVGIISRSDIVKAMCR